MSAIEQQEARRKLADAEVARAAQAREEDYVRWQKVHHVMGRLRG